MSEPALHTTPIARQTGRTHREGPFERPIRDAAAGEAGFEPLPVYLAHNKFVHDIGNDGRAAVEIPNAPAPKAVRAFVQGLVDAFGRATAHLRGQSRDDGAKRERDR